MGGGLNQLVTVVLHGVWGVGQNVAYIVLCNI